MPLLPPPGRCIYCPSPGTTNEHIIPQSLGGRLVLQRASCEDCRKITSEFERVVTREMYWPLRLKLGFVGSRKHRKERPTHWLGVLQDGDKIEDMAFEVGKFPRVYATMKFASPGILRNEPPNDRNPQMSFLIKGDENEVAAFMKELGVGRLKITSTLQWGPFARMIAKICHAFAVSVVGLEGIDFYLPPLIRGKSDHLAQFVGGVDLEDESLVPPVDLLVTERVVNGQPHLIARTTIFRDRRFPTYEAIVGRILDPDLIRAKIASAQQI